MSVSLFDDRCKGIHIKLNRETHSLFKTMLIQHGLSMQEAFEEFARLVGSGNLTANALLSRYIRNKAKIELAEVGITISPRRKKMRITSELNDENLYGLISEGDDEPIEDAIDELA